MLMLPPRTYFVEEYTVREHYRTIHAKPYKIVCRSCRQAVTRIAYRLPLDCDRCRPPKPEIKGETKQNEKRPKPIEVQTDNSRDLA